MGLRNIYTYVCRKYHWEGEEEIGTVIPLAWKFGMKEKADKMKGKCVYIYIYFFFFPFYYNLLYCLGFPGGTSGKEPTCQCRRHTRLGFDP